MKTIGLIGGMTWESSLEYYRVINESIKEELGGSHSAKCVLYSVDFNEIEMLHRQKNWPKATEIMIDAGQKLKKAGADFLIICTNLMHKMAEDVRTSTNLPLLHIVDATSAKIKDCGMTKVGLLGSIFTMEEDFYKKRLLEKHGIEVVIPEKEDRRYVGEAVYHEFSIGRFTDKTSGKFKEIILKLQRQGAEGIILGCTEIPLYIKQKDYDIMLFDTTTLHAKAAAAYALGEFTIAE